MHFHWNIFSRNENTILSSNINYSFCFQIFDLNGTILREIGRFRDIETTIARSPLGGVVVCRHMLKDGDNWTRMVTCSTNREKRISVLATVPGELTYICMLPNFSFFALDRGTLKKYFLTRDGREETQSKDLYQLSSSLNKLSVACDRLRIWADKIISITDSKEIFRCLILRD